MSDGNRNENENVSAMALLNSVRQFHDIAELAYTNSLRTDAVYSQYLHVVELLFKDLPASEKQRFLGAWDWPTLQRLS
jgi:hypothetical protein